MTNRHRDLRRDAVAIYAAAVAGVEPGRAVARSLLHLAPPDRVWLVAIGKAAAPMVDAAVRHLARHGRVPLGGVVVTPDAGPPPDRHLVRERGDHPLPGDGSARAARAVETWIARVEPTDTVWVFLSGGASSLIGAPVAEVTPDDYRALQSALFGAGLSIDRLNTIRKRFARLGGGRAMARLPATVEVFALSDVPSDDPADIGSGPFEPDPTTAAQVERMLVDAVGADRVPSSVGRYLARVTQGESPETPKPGDPVFRRRSTRIVGSNRIALEHAADRARALGYAVAGVRSPLEGPAAAAGRALADLIAGTAIDGPSAWLFGGETTVALDPGSGLGGRCQELGLAAALRLAAAPPGEDEVVLLAAGTDGRDGPTDAAGALVDRDTWQRIQASGIDPATALARHDAYPALNAASGLIRTGLTGTNVMDVVIGLKAKAK